MLGRNGRNATKQKITLDTPVPNMPTKLLDLPSEIDLERTIDSIDSKIMILKDSIEDTLAEIRTCSMQGINEARNPAVKQVIAGLREEMKIYRDQRAIKIAELKEIRNEFQDLLEANQKIKKNIITHDFDKVCQRIQDIQYQIGHETLHPSEEKRLIQEIQHLQLSKPYVKEQSDRQQLIDENKSQQKAKTYEIEMYSKQIDAYGQEIDRVINELKDRAQDIESRIPELKEQKRLIEGEINSQFEARRQARRDWRTAQDSYYDQQRQIKQIDFIKTIHARIISNEAKQKAWEEQQAEKAKQRAEEQERREKIAREREIRNKERQERFQKQREQEELTRPHPWAYELSICQRLVSYCNFYKPSADVQSTQDTRKMGQSLQQLETQAEKEATLLAQWNTKPKKEKKLRQRKSKQDSILQLPMMTLNDFAFLQIQVPKSSNDIQKTLETLGEKIDHFEKLPRSHKPQTSSSKLSKNEKAYEPSSENFPVPIPQTSSYQSKVDVLFEEVGEEWEKYKREESTRRSRGPRGYRRRRGYYT